MEYWHGDEDKDEEKFGEEKGLVTHHWRSPTRVSLWTTRRMRKIQESTRKKGIKRPERSKKKDEVELNSGEVCQR